MKRCLVIEEKSDEPIWQKNARIETPKLQMNTQLLDAETLAEATATFFKSDSVKYLTDEENRVKVFGKVYQVPRKQCMYATRPGTTYKFSGLTMKAHDEQELPVLAKIREAVERETKTQFNVAVINYYADGQNTIGWHADDEGEMVKDSPIASVSFGATRDFRFRLKADHSVTHGVALTHNMLCVMHFPTNRDWEHSVPKRAGVSEPRVNITFRTFK